jgi:hypothetical protein
MTVLSANPSDVTQWATLRSQLAETDSAGKSELLSNQARLARRQIIQMIDAAGLV